VIYVWWSNQDIIPRGRLKSSEKSDSSKSERPLLLGNHLIRSNPMEQVGIETMKVVPHFDDSLLPKASLLWHRRKRIVVNAPRFAAFIPKKPVGKACPGFLKVVGGIKKRIHSVFEFTARNSTNASVIKCGS
jgi:hypothetical protein